ncbi:hypothetical protein Tfu_1254 [Thermobifida fusca YX]|nr:hypothetical protein Tfu_1254 [Thermobifida fusca YX]
MKTDHPHVRGEHVCGAAAPEDVVGPSPRAWGARVDGRPVRARARTIPTCVGSTLIWSSPRRRSADHPHVRGEHTGAETGFGAGERTIPTCVGSTGSCGFSLTRKPDHPHVRGEHELRREGIGVEVGPSPRAWGAREARGKPRV